MKYFFCTLFSLFTLCVAAKPLKHKTLTYFKADNSRIKYVGRIDFSDAAKPRFWAPGVYIQAKFKGTSLQIFVNDEVLYGNVHNYLEIVIDDNKPLRIQTTGKVNAITVADNLSPGVHTVTICKDTEAGNGYIEFLGLKCGKLLRVHQHKRKIEFIGDSITCGFGEDASQVKCDSGQWYDQHNAYMSYGPTAARMLNAQWHITAVSGIGLIHSCCGNTVLMPQVFDKVKLKIDSLQWDFSKYVPNVVTICLGQNDGKQDSVAFCSAYVNFINRIRAYYPKADIVCLNSPMANKELTVMLKKYILGIEQYENSNGDSRVHHFFVTSGFNNGCLGHPSMAQQQVTANEVAGYIKELERW